MPQILIATHNPSKADYFKALLKDFPLEILSLADLSVSEKVEEDGENELENAAIKAKFYGQLTGRVSLADDAGMYIPALNNEPGVQVRRWGGRFPNNISDEEWLEYFWQKIKDIPNEKRVGYFQIGRAIYDPKVGQCFFQRWRRDFKILPQPAGKRMPGWPLANLVYDININKVWAEITPQDQLAYEKENVAELQNIFAQIFS
ncbi:hypothetical protein D6821_00545 [Candidatus Parcubacteria bacterium]|nr:MAG: hypothetical protein D6821_00545 [Candidatus Parcubacteria bacterium]